MIIGNRGWRVHIILKRYVSNLADDENLIGKPTSIEYDRVTKESRLEWFACRACMCYHGKLDKDNPPTSMFILLHVGHKNKGKNKECWTPCN